MIKQWILSHRSLAAAAMSSTLVMALIVTIAVVSGGYSAQKVALNDASVWVANATDQFVGRANTEVFELNSVIASDSADIELIQSGSTVLVLDRTAATLSLVDPATSEFVDSVPLPPNQPQVYLAGENVVVFGQSTGELWIFPLRELESFDAGASPALSFDADTVVSVDENGTLFAYSPVTDRVVRLDAADSAVEPTTDSSALPDIVGAAQITSVAGRWAVLDVAGARLEVEGSVIELGEVIADNSAPRLQRASGGTVGSDGVLISYTGGLISVDYDSGEITELAANQGGLPASPVVVAGCVFAAWSSGSAWRLCENDAAQGLPIVLVDMPAASDITFQVNEARVVLNDARAGASWAVQSSGEIIDNWQDLIEVEQDQQQIELNDQDTPPETEKTQLPPVAVDDAFGARPSQTSVLPVLLNDYDPNGDVLLIDSFTPIDPSVGRLDLIDSQQKVQLTLTPEARGSVTFGYTISDGRGGTDSANVTVQVRSSGENSPPAQVRPTKATVESGGSVSVTVLADWVDPDGDPFYLASAAVSEPDAVTYSIEGTVVYRDAGSTTGLKPVTLIVTDGQAEAAGAIQVTVRDVGSVPIIADPFVVLVYAGRETTVSPLDHVRGGNSEIRLNSVPDKPGATITPSYTTGTFRFVSDEVRTHYIEYVVTDGDQTATGLVRVDVAAPAEANTAPITIPKTVYVQLLQNKRLDVAGTDIDPAGGVLLVTGVMNIPAQSGVRAEILEQRLVRVSLDAPLDDGPVVFNYRISNGLAEAQGTITVVEVQPPSQLQPPIAVDDVITVRQGAAIDIPVLANDVHPDGQTLTLLPALGKELPEDGGLLFASGDRLRYLAPTVTGNFTAAYDVAGPDSQVARGQVRIEVREADLATNSAPVPPTVTARVLAGETVRIRIPLSGTDPDGDTVQLLGQATNPEKGLVQSVTSDSFEYRAGEYSAGTDSFTYTVIDALGARATGVVRVGISARLDGARNPIAIRDEVRVRPGVAVNVQVLANDSDPDSSPLTVDSAEPNDVETTAEIIDDVVRITPPRTAGTYGVIYTISNETGGTSTNFVTVTVDPDAPLSYPVARDTVLTLSDILGRDSIDVDVLANVFFADGDARELGLSVQSGFDGAAEVTANKRLRVSILDASQIIPFRVTHPDDAKVSSYAFVWVPGYDDALPQIDTRAKALEVNSEDPLIIDINDYVIAIGGGDVRLTDTSTVQATRANGDNLVVNAQTLRFTSQDKYFGPASISFEVTDGASATDPQGRTAILVLPITVKPRTNQPPVFGGAVIEFEPGQSKELDLVRLTNYPFDDIDELEYTALAPAPIGFSYTLSGQSLTVRADESAAKGTVTSLALGVRDDLNVGTPGRIELTVVPSTRPLASPTADNSITRRGESTQIDVLANDQATNPFPSTPLSVVDIRGIDGASLPAGVVVTPSANRRSITATIAGSAEPVDINLQYQVADATNDPDRYVWGTVRISIQDRPSPVTQVRVTNFANRQLTVAWNSAQFNNSPITGYDVVLTDASTGSVYSTTTCAGAQCDVTTPGNGEANAVRISVVATNAIGSSDPAILSGPIWSDVVPPAPTSVSSVPRDGGLRISWTKPAETGSGSPITSYVVTVAGSATTLSRPSSDQAGTVYTFDATGLSNGSSVAFSVSPRNQSVSSLANWNSASGTGFPAGAPVRASSPVATATVEDGSTATIVWNGAFSSNGRAISQYYAAIYTGTAPVCTVSGELPGTAQPPTESSTVRHTGTGTSATFTGLSANVTYSFVVFAFNGMGCTDSAVVAATPRERPGVVTGFTTTGQPEASGTGTWDYRLTGVVASGDWDTFMYRWVGGSIAPTSYGPVSVGSFLTADSGAHYGTSLSLELLACKQYETLLCSSTWSSAQSVGVPVQSQTLGSRSFVITEDREPGPDTAEYRWLDSPSGDYTSVTFSCDGGISQTAVVPGGPNTCAVVSDGDGNNFSPLTITITANGAAFVRTYNPNDF
ncbi:MAG: Ig-like domain-containing protein [Microbacteriaceae bacterium]